MWSLFHVVRFKINYEMECMRVAVGWRVSFSDDFFKFEMKHHI